MEIVAVKMEWYRDLRTAEWEYVYTVTYANGESLNTPCWHPSFEPFLK